VLVTAVLVTACWTDYVLIIVMTSFSNIPSLWHGCLQTHKCWDMSQEDLRRRLMEPGTWTDKQLPYNDAKISRDKGVCNGWVLAMASLRVRC
jgi:hypothetical protein